MRLAQFRPAIKRGELHPHSVGHGPQPKDRHPVQPRKLDFLAFQQGSPVAAGQGQQDIPLVPYPICPAPSFRESYQNQVGVSCSFSVNRRCPTYILSVVLSAGRPIRSEHHQKTAGVPLEAQLHPLVLAESHVIVDVFYRPEYLFQSTGRIDGRRSRRSTSSDRRWKICSTNSGNPSSFTSDESTKLSATLMFLHCICG